MNETKYIGLLKLAFKPCGIKKETVQQMLLEVLMMSGRLLAKDNYLLVVRPCRGHFDNIMTDQYVRLKAFGPTLRVFSVSDKQSLALVPDVQDAQAVMQATRQIADVPQSAKLTSRILLGRSMFGFAENHIVGALFAKKVEELLDQLFSVKPITQAAI